MRPHLPEDELHAWLDQQLSRAQSREIAEHLMACLICRALEAEVRGIRDRTSALLAIAAPREIQGMPAAIRQRASRRQVRRSGIAAAAAVAIGLGSWAIANHAPTNDGPGISTAFVAPAILARIGDLTSSDSANAASADGANSRTLALAARATVSPRVIPSRVVHTPVSNRRLKLVDPMLRIGPSGDGWETASLAEAQERSAGAVAHLNGVSVNAVRLQASVVGGRPTAMVRHLMADGRAVWVIEGTVQDLEPISRVLEASGLTLSTPRRGLPDYLGSTDAPVRTTRMVTVAGYLPFDSLETIAASKLTLD